MPTIVQHRPAPTANKNRYLSHGAENITSQCGEDGIIMNLFNKIGVAASGPWCVEFGASDGKLYSNTYNLIQGNRWSGVLIEGNKARFAKLQETYRGVERAHLVHAIVSYAEGPQSLDVLLGQTPIPVVFDFLSIDIDGNDWYVWESLVRFRPRVVIIEFNPTVPNDVFFLQDKDPAINQGCSLRALIDLGKSKGYELVASTTCNGFFVIQEEFAKFGLEDNSIDAIHTPIIEGKVFHGYDGTIFTVGMERLFWHDRSIAQDALQLFSEEERQFPDRLPPSQS